MLLFNIGFLLDDPFGFFLFFSSIAVALVVGISVHEFSHAAAANLQGDMTATRLGRLTLNPRAHLDPAGTILLVVVGVGYGRPVPVNPLRLRNGRRGMALVSAAGPASNVVLAVTLAAFFQIGALDMANLPRSPFAAFDPLVWGTITGFFMVQLNLTLAALNLLPIPPLDGGRIAVGLLPPPLAMRLARLERLGIIIILGAVFILPWIGGMLGVDLNVFWWLVGGPAAFLMDLIVTLVGI